MKQIRLWSKPTNQKENYWDNEKCKDKYNLKEQLTKGEKKVETTRIWSKPINRKKDNDKDKYHLEKESLPKESWKLR